MHSGLHVAAEYAEWPRSSVEGSYTPIMTTPQQRTVVSDMSFTECPRWHDGRLWFVDFYTHAVYSVKEDGSELRTELEVPAQPSGLGWLPDGRLLVVSMKHRTILRLEDDGSVVVHADVSAHVTGHPLSLIHI